jgi:arogenate dehydrogenase (NADP+)
MKLGIVGLGLIGGSLGLDARALGHTVVGVSRKDSTCKSAIALGAVDDAGTNVSILSQVDVVFLCTPLSKILSTTEQILPFLPKTAILTDVGSVKAPIVAQMQALLAEVQSQNPFVGGHPMAGTAETGIQAALSNLFRGNPYVLTPTETTPIEAVKTVAGLVRSLGATLYECDPTTHDRAVALISHLPVMVSASLIEVCRSERNATVRALVVQLASSGFRDTSRVGGGNPELGRMMAEFNTDALLASLYQYRSQLDTMINHVEMAEWDALEAKLLLTQRDRTQYLKD